jgi:hypothetical protein
MIYYSEIVTPWPFSNRDMVLHFKITQDPNTKIITVILTSMSDYIPEKEGIIRITKSNSILKVTPTNASNLSIDFFIELDPGGSVPAWLINLFATQGPWETFHELRNLTTSGNYTGSGAPFIMDLDD